MVFSTINVITLICIIAYLTFCVIIGLRKNVTNTSTKEYFIAGKKVGPFLLFMTCFASFCGSGNFLGFAGKVASSGTTAYWLFFGDVFLGLVCFSIFLAPYLAKFDYFTMPHYISHYLCGNDMLVRRISGISAAIGNVAITGMQIMGMSYMLRNVLGVNVYAALIIAGAIVVFYTAFGGMDAVIFTDSIQGMLQIFVVVFTVIFGFKLVNWNIAGIFNTVTNMDPQMTSLFGVGGWKACISGALTGFLGTMSNPIFWNRAFVAQDVKTAKKGFLGSMSVSVLATFLVMTLGFLVYSINKDAGDIAIVWLIVNKFPAWFTPFAVIGLMGAIMSTADTHLNSGIANIVCDVIDPREKLSVEQSIKTSKIAGFVAGGLAILGAAVAPSLLDLSYTGLVILGGTLFPIFIIGYILRDKTSEQFRSNLSIKAAQWGLGVGLVAALAFQLIPSLSAIIGGGIIPSMAATTITVLVLNKVFKPEYPVEAK